MDLTTCYLSFVVLVTYIIQESDAIGCYICSFSPYDKNNRTDHCTEENFEAEKVYVHDCPLGCESFIQYDANDVLEHWRRNCLREGQVITDDCKVTSFLGWRQIRCTCNRDLCNVAIVQQAQWSCLLLPLLLMHLTLHRTLFT